MIDEEGFRSNVGIILANHSGKLFWGRRPGHYDSWQFPQGGIDPEEDIEQAMYRELEEEVGLLPEHVRILAVSNKWLTYYLPEKFRRYNRKPLCIGQKQKWFLLELMDNDDQIRFDRTDSPEFVDWRWVDYWLPVQKVINFKRQVYQNILREFEPVVESKLSCDATKNKPPFFLRRNKFSLYSMKNKNRKKEPETI